MRQWEGLRDDHGPTASSTCAITVPQDPPYCAGALVTAAQYLALGVDPARHDFVQSHVPAHTGSGLGAGLFHRLRAGVADDPVQDKSLKQGADSTTVGLFTPPRVAGRRRAALDTNLVPVGEDQRQHLELARDVAQRFNSGSRTPWWCRMC